MEHLIKITIESIPMASVLNSYKPNDLLYRDICSSDQPTRDDQKVVKLVSAVRNGLERKKADQTDPGPKVTAMRKSEMSSIVVDVACQTEQSFLSFMEDFKDVKDRLEAEFKNSELPWRLYVTNDNEAEVHEKLKNIRYLLSAFIIEIFMIYTLLQKRCLRKMRKGKSQIEIN